MKSVLFSLAILVLSAGAAEARYIGPLLSKSTNTGFVPAGMSQATVCDIYRDKIVITLIAGGISSKLEHAITLDGELGLVIQDAADAKVVVNPGPIDGPSMIYSAFIINPDDTVRTVDLGSINGGSGNFTQNKSVGAATLRNFLDLNCK